MKEVLGFIEVCHVVSFSFKRLITVFHQEKGTYRAANKDLWNMARLLP
jgi:hypothetical protein